MLIKTFIEKMTYLIKKFEILLILLFSLYSFTIANSTENKIVYKVNDEIITKFDLTREFRYLALINPRVIDLEKNEIFEISKNSIIREKIKKIEILKHVKEINLEENYINELMAQNYSKFKINNTNEFEKKLSEIGFTIDEFKEKLSIEALWNQLIFQKYYSKVKIDKIKLKKEVISKKKQSVFNLSEIVFIVEDDQNYKKKLEIIKKEIKTKGFENAALLHSISETKSVGGDLGWIDENSINLSLSNQIKKLKIGDFTEPVVIPGGFLILKLKDIKEKKVAIDIENEINKLIKLKTNQQLNQFSNIYFNKIKKNIKIEKI